MKRRRRTNAEAPAVGAPRRGSFHEGFAFGGLSSVAGACLSLASGIIVARLYGIETIGAFALASAPTGAVWFLSSVREQPALVRALTPLEPGDPRVTGLWAAVFAFSQSLTLIASAVATGLSYVLFNGPIGHPELFVPAVVTLAGNLLFTNVAWNLDTVFGAFRAGRQLFWVRLHQSASYLVFATLASFVLPTVWGLVAAVMASWSTSLVHRLLRIGRWMRLVVPLDEIRTGFRSLPEILRFGFKLTPGFLAHGTTAESGTWILGVISTVPAVGAWNRAWLFAQRLQDVNGRIFDMVLPTLVERRLADDDEGFASALADSMRYLATAMLLPAAVGGGAAAGVMGLFGQGFDRAENALPLILVVPALVTVATIQAQALLALDRPSATSLFELGRMVVTLTAGTLLAARVGITGMAVGMVAGCLLQLALQARALGDDLVRRVTRLWTPRSMLALGAAYAAAFACARLLDSSLPGATGVLAASAGGTACFVVMLATVGGVLPRDRERLATLWPGKRRHETRLAEDPPRALEPQGVSQP
jgi:O-antigen/teichoic acid export membrane protein